MTDVISLRSEKSAEKISLQQIRKEQAQAANPDILGAGKTGYGRLDLRALQTSLYKQQRAQRTSGLAAAQKKVAQLKHRNRVKAPLLAGCKVQDTRKSRDGTRLYFEISNGQALRTDRVLGVRKLTNRCHKRIGAGLPMKKHTKRGAEKPVNTILAKICRDEIRKNADRAEVAA